MAEPAQPAPPALPPGSPLPPPSCLIPLAVAVTGHRDLAPADEDQVRDLVREGLAALRAEQPATPLVALSGLAEGADMVFAEAALAAGAELVAVLPARPEVFARDFDHPAHAERQPAALRERFSRLLSRCSQVVVVAENLPATDPRRYARVGAYLLRHAHLLLALWDGRESDQEGGTAQVAHLARTGAPSADPPSPCRALDAPAPIPVHHLRTPRRGERLAGSFTWQILQAGAPADTLADLHAFNQSAREFAGRNQAAVDQALADLNLPDHELTFAEQRIQQVYGVADAMAGALQRRNLRHLGIIHGVSLVMLAAFAIHSTIVANLYLYLLYFLAFSLGLFWYGRGRKQRVYPRFVDYRGLAEGLRVQLFFRLAGAPARVADLYLRKQQSELAWLRQALRVLDIGPPRLEPRPELVRASWIEAQAGYYANAQKRDAKALALFKRISFAGFGTGLLVGAAGLLLEGAKPALHDSDLLHWLFLFTGLLPGAGALASSYAQRRGLAQHVREYAQMGEIFRRAARQVSAGDLTQDPGAFRELVLELGREALAEHAQWVVQHRELPPNLPGS
ncbi:MAG: hypothetical protein KQJ78_18400 [Deltaproteobacteria bacterium]|nr:hypothetical protein [Deltaproteobacteria bacterium]